VDATHLTPEQLEAFRRQIGQHRIHIEKIVTRMRERAWYSADPTLCALQAAASALQSALCSLNVAEKLPKPPPPEPKVVSNEGYPFPTNPAVRSGLPDAMPAPSRRQGRR
jgi:hypothetical protein